MTTLSRPLVPGQGVGTCFATTGMGSVVICRPRAQAGSGPRAEAGSLAQVAAAPLAQVAAAPLAQVAAGSLARVAAEDRAGSG
ncbi:hypothetical protein ABN034_17475 [Actinopolymorpha sp. B11F2]|uniref:hypothetical protein n=1 Tax=Actinopolymorpha sp. B11F2 TaxID=3160862 RepID=UPI0032E4973E